MIFKNNGSDEILTLLFKKIYKFSLIPSIIWNLAIIKLIHKNALADPCLPLEYRGISLLSTFYKLFISVLNKKIVQTAETNSLYSDEQNGFKKIDTVRTSYSHSHQLSEIENVKDYPHILPLLILKKYLIG